MLQNRAGYWPLMAALAEALPTLTNAPTAEDRRHLRIVAAALNPKLNPVLAACNRYVKDHSSNLNPTLNPDLDQIDYAQLAAEAAIKPQAKSCG